MSELISYEISEGVGKIIFNRPEKFNSVNKEIALALQGHLTNAEKDETVRCVFLTGNGRAFCAGQDLNEIMDPDNGINLEEVVSQHYNPIIMKMRTLAIPIVTAINGVAAGAGANIALAGDIIVAKESATFIQAFSKIGLIPDSGGTYLLPRLVGWQKASALMMLGEKITAREAERIGMIYKYFPDEEFEQKSWKIAVQLAQSPTVCLQLTKLALNESLTNNLVEQLSLEEQLQSRASQTEDYQEGVQAFLEKRNANFKGR